MRRLAILAIAVSALSVAIPAASASAAPAGGFVEVFLDANFSGQGALIGDGQAMPDFGKFVGSTTSFQDKVSSIINESDHDYCFFVDNNFRGISLPEPAHTREGSIGAFNDKLSSARIC
ncbi:peptidase inhibitor family I36 protein [Amycolatopsis rhabdoformis]|uniref:Peptidase inhibitor family I36 protein n=1 Tax=Amycolatopsis rhabdoformis TaxID=1448059 RepID=A0ABZ1ID59_9PSEU|nr:peptidase inhibitor family I36 protein [Amycolatopsis rhabdoformis]WSE32197.1 peptidase inhibitor family I36 protein [Amycolatopsis rhabdoformis]